MIDLIVSYASIWAPSLVAIIGTIASIVMAIRKAQKAIDDLRKDETIKQVSKELKDAVSTNKELVECNKLLLDRITQIEGYVEGIKNEKRKNK